MLEENPEKTNTTEDVPEAQPSAEPDVPAEQEVPEGVAESAAGTEEAGDASGEPQAEPDREELIPGSNGDSPTSAAAAPPEEVAAEEQPEPEAAPEPAPEPEAAPEPAAAAAPATEEAPAAPEGAAAPEAAPEEEEEEGAGDPYGGPGDWYVIHTYAGYENKVKTNLGSRIQTMQMQDKIFDVVIPMEDVMEIKGGRKQVVQKKVFPGYLLVKMIYDDESWFVVRNTPGVTGFVSSGTGQKPTPLSRREVERILGRKKEEAKPAFRLDFEVDDVVRIISGPFADFNGTIAEINLDQSKVKVMVNIFDRETPVELGFDQVARV
ncbi:MAG: transcription termination/antitermination protein NusG [Actinomycetota bacterium]